MTKRSGLGQRLFVGGHDISGDVGAIDNVASPLAALDVTSLRAQAMERLGGLRDGALDFTAFFNPGPEADAAHDVLSALPVADVALMYCTGTAIGDPAACMIGKQIGYDGKRGTDGTFTLSVTSQANAFGLEWGRLLTAGARADTAATNGASWDDGAATAFGLQAYLQVLAFTGTSATIKLQESGDDGVADSWTDVVGGSFGAQSATGAARLQTARALAVERYLRVVTTGTFTACTFAVAVVRNPIAVAF